MAGQNRTMGMGIQKWLTLLLILILLPLFALQGYRYYALYQEKQQEALQANLEMARAVAKSFETFVQDVLRTELAIGLAITSSSKVNPGDILRILETSRDYPAVRDFTWLNPKGLAIYSNNPAIMGTDFSDRSYVRDVISGREWAVGELVTGKLFGKPIFGISRGIRDGQGELLGIVFAAIVPDRLDAQLAIERSKGGAVSIVDRNGILVYRYPALDTSWEERNWLRQYPEYEEVLKGKEISQTFFAAYEGKERLVSLAPISTIGWAAGAGLRKEDVTGPFIQSLIRDAVLFLSVSLIAFVIGAALSRKITKPIETLRIYASSLGDGKIPQQVDVENVSELRDLAESFDAMAEKVRARERALSESEAHFRSFVTASSDVVYRMSPDWSEMRQLHGRGFLADTDNPSRTWPQSYIHPEDQPYVTAVIREAIRTKSIFELEHRVRRADGTLGWTFSRAVPLLDAKGEIVEWFGAASDITERKRAEEALKESRNLLNATQHLAKIGGWTWDVAGQAMTWTDETYRIHGITPGNPAPGSPEHIALSLACYDPADRPIIEAAFRCCAEEGRS